MLLPLLWKDQSLGQYFQWISRIAEDSLLSRLLLVGNRVFRLQQVRGIYLQQVRGIYLQQVHAQHPLSIRHSEHLVQWYLLTYIPSLLQIHGHLRCRFTKNNPRRTTSTPAGVFCTLLASAPSICKRRCNTATDANVKKYTSVYIAQHRHGWRWFQTVAMFWLCQNSRPKVYKDVHFWTALGIEAVSFLPFIDKAKRYKRIARRHSFSAL